MQAFLVGFLVVLMAIVLWGIGILMIPILLVLGLALRLVFSGLFLILMVWLVGKMTLWLIELMKRDGKNTPY